MKKIFIKPQALDNNANAKEYILSLSQEEYTTPDKKKKLQLQEEHSYIQRHPKLKRFNLQDFMHFLNQARPTTILISGYRGSGKSTFIQQLIQQKENNKDLSRSLQGLFFIEIKVTEYDKNNSERYQHVMRNIIRGIHNQYNISIYNYSYIKTIWFSFVAKLTTASLHIFRMRYSNQTLANWKKEFIKKENYRAIHKPEKKKRLSRIMWEIHKRTKIKKSLENLYNRIYHEITYTKMTNTRRKSFILNHKYTIILLIFLIPFLTYIISTSFAQPLSKKIIAAEPKEVQKLLSNYFCPAKLMTHNKKNSQKSILQTNSADCILLNNVMDQILSWSFSIITGIAGLFITYKTIENFYESRTIFDDEIQFEELTRALKNMDLLSIRPVFIFDELDKLESEEITAFIKRFRTLFSYSQASFILIVGQNFYYEMQKLEFHDDEIIRSVFGDQFHIDLIIPEEVEIFFRNIFYFEKKLISHEKNFLAYLCIESAMNLRQLINLIRQHSKIYPDADIKEKYYVEIEDFNHDKLLYSAEYLSDHQKIYEIINNVYVSTIAPINCKPGVNDYYYSMLFILVKKLKTRIGWREGFTEEEILTLYEDVNEQKDQIKIPINPHWYPFDERYLLQKLLKELKNAYIFSNITPDRYQWKQYNGKKQK